MIIFHSKLIFHLLGLLVIMLFKDGIQMTQIKQIFHR